MDISEIKWPARRRRGRYSNEFKREVVKACQAPGVSTASVALANGINANLLRRWVAEWGDGTQWDREEQSEPAALTHKPEFVRMPPRSGRWLRCMQRSSLSWSEASIASWPRDLARCVLHSYVPPKFDTCGQKRGVLGCVLASWSRKINSLAVLAERCL